MSHTPASPTPIQAKPLERFGRRWDDTAAAVAAEPIQAQPLERFGRLSDDTAKVRGMSLPRLRGLIRAIEHELRARSEDEGSAVTARLCLAATADDLRRADAALFIHAWDVALDELQCAADNLQALRS